MSYHRYKIRWGNYKSDDYKSRKVLKEEIRDILTLGKFSVEELVNIKNYTKGKGFKECGHTDVGGYWVDYDPTDKYNSRP